MGKIYLTPEIQGERPFRCFKCNKRLVLDVQGEQRLVLWCDRCKTKFTVETSESLPPALSIRAGTLINQ